MKKYLLFLIGAFFVFNANAEGVVLSDTYVADDDFVEEPFEAPSTASAQNQSGNYVKQQVSPGFKNVLSNDTSDPLFLIGDNQFLTDSFINSVHRTLQLGQYIGYGINHNLAMHANMHYQIDFSGRDENGFSATEFGGEYRMNHGTGRTHIISDVLFGIKLWGSSHVRSPEYAESSYYAGLRFGRQYSGVTLAGTVKSTWVFDDNRGLSYIDFMPDIYFRFKYDWHAGIGGDIRRSTNKILLDNQEWINFKLLRQYGNTQYVGHVDYEFGDGDVQFGFNLKVLF